MGELALVLLRRKLQRVWDWIEIRKLLGNSFIIKFMEISSSHVVCIILSVEVKTSDRFLWEVYWYVRLLISKATLFRSSYKKCSENMQQICRRTPMPKSDFNKFAKQLYWNHTSVWVFSCKFAACFQNTFF